MGLIVLRLSRGHGTIIVDLDLRSENVMSIRSRRFNAY